MVRDFIRPGRNPPQLGQPTGAQRFPSYILHNLILNLRVAEYGFGYFEVFNATHLRWTMKRATDSTTIDEAWIVKPAPQ